jgi:hypothetical protein
MLVLISAGSAAQGMPDAALVAGDSHGHDSLMVQIDSAATLPWMELAIEQQNDSLAFPENIVRPGRDYSRAWIGAEPIPVYPSLVVEDGVPNFDPYFMPDDINRSQTGIFRSRRNLGWLRIDQPLVTTYEPYTHLNYQLGGYNHGSLYARHRQVFSRWGIDIAGINESGDDGHPGNIGDQAQILAKAYYALSQSARISLLANVQRHKYSYRRWRNGAPEGDAAVDEQQVDLWTLRYTRDFNRSRWQMGLQYFWREGNWQHSNQSGYRSDYHIYSPYTSYSVWDQRQRLDAYAAIHVVHGKFADDSQQRNELAGRLQLLWTRAWLAIMQSRLQVMGGSLENGHWYFYSAFSVLLWQQLQIRFAYDHFPGYSENGVFNGGNGQHVLLALQWERMILPGLRLLAAGSINSYRELPFAASGWQPRHIDYQLLRLQLDYNYKWLRLGLQGRQRLGTWRYIPENQFAATAGIDFYLLNSLRIKAASWLSVLNNYLTYDLDLEHGNLVPGADGRDLTWQLDFRVAAVVGDFEIYYSGIHVDAFMGNTRDHELISGFAHDLPRYRFGVSWTLLN